MFQIVPACDVPWYPGILETQCFRLYQPMVYPGTLASWRHTQDYIMYLYVSDCTTLWCTLVPWPPGDTPRIILCISMFQIVPAYGVPWYPGILETHPELYYESLCFRLYQPVVYQVPWNPEDTLRIILWISMFQTVPSHSVLWYPGLLETHPKFIFPLSPWLNSQDTTLQFPF